MQDICGDQFLKAYIDNTKVLDVNQRKQIKGYLWHPGTTRAQLC